MLGLALAALLAQSDLPNAQLARAEAQLKVLAYADALRSLDAALQLPGNDRTTLARIFELQGIAAGVLDQQERSEHAFRRLLSLEPLRALGTNLPPRVTTPFYAARAFVGDAGPLRLEWDAAGGGGLVARVRGDTSNLARAVRISFADEAGARRSVELPLANGQVSIPTAAASGALKAELLGAHRSVLASLHREPPRLDAPRPSVAPPPDPVVVQEAEAASWRRTTGYVGLAAGGLALGVGGYLGVRSTSARSAWEGAGRDGEGRVSGVTRDQALRLERESITSARAANVLFLVGGALAAGGAALWLWDLAVLPAPSGLVVSARLP